MCRLRNIAMRDYQESVTTGQTDAGQSDPDVPLCFAGHTETNLSEYLLHITVHVHVCYTLELVGWLVVLRIYVVSAVFQPYRDLEAGDNQSLEI